MRNLNHSISATIILFFTAVIIIFTQFSCKQDPLQNPGDNIISIATGNNISKNYAFNFRKAFRNTKFFEFEIKCLTPENFSPKSMELISYKEIIDITTEELKSVEISHKKNNLLSSSSKFNFLINSQPTHSIFFPKNANQRGSSIVNKIKAHDFKYNEIMRMEYSFPSDSTNLPNHVKSIGYINYSDPDSEGNQIQIDWESIAKDKNNLFGIYRSSVASKRVDWRNHFKH